MFGRSDEPSPFSGATALVTGGASGIGRALGARLAGLGSDVVLADMDGDAVAAAARGIATASGSSVEGRCVDVRDLDGLVQVIDETIDRTGRIDYLFNNAGISIGGPTHEMTPEHWNLVIDVNLRGVVNGVLAAYPRMVAQGSGHIVNTASAAGLVAPPMVVGYAATKHAVVGLSTGLRPEASRHGVKVSVLCPGMVDTPILDRSPSGLPDTASVPVTPREYLRVAKQRPISADRCADLALAEVARNRAIIVVPRSAGALWYVFRLSPSLAERAGRLMAARVDAALIRPR